MHCFLEIKDLSLLCAPGRKLNCASSPGSINCFNMFIYSSLSPNFKSTFPTIYVVLFILPEVSIQKTRVESFSVARFSCSLYRR